MVSMLANAWSRRGLRVTVIALYQHEVLYSLDSSVRLISIPDWEGTNPLVRLLMAIREAIETPRVKAAALWRSPLSGAGVEAHAVADGPRSLRERFGKGLAQFQHAVFRRRWSRGVWKLHLPTYLRVRALRKAIQHANAHNVISFCGSANVASILACEKLPNHLVISERNDPARQVLRFPWNPLRRGFYGDADVVTANTLGAIEAMKDYVAPERLACVPNPVKPPAKSVVRQFKI